jgi:hypothetical protein
VADHATDKQGELEQIRISHIPRLEGADWRWLPNIEVQCRIVQNGRVACPQMDGAISDTIILPTVPGQEGAVPAACVPVCGERELQEAREQGRLSVPGDGR